MSITLCEISGPIPFPGKRTTFLLLLSEKKNFDWYFNRFLETLVAVSMRDDSIKVEKNNYCLKINVI
jgi:hypothetical protein